MKIYLTKFDDFMAEVVDNKIGKAFFTTQYSTQQVELPPSGEGQKPREDVLVRANLTLTAEYAAEHETAYLLWMDEVGRALASDEPKMKELYELVQKAEQDTIKAFKSQHPRGRLIPGMVTTHQVK